MFQEIIQFFEDFGQIGMFIHSFIDAIFFPIPAFFLQVSLSVLNPKNALMLATIGYLASLLGTPVGYYIGKLVGNNFLQKIVKEKWITQASGLFKKNGEIAIFIGAFTPIPFKVFTILAGMFHFSLWKLLGYAALGAGRFSPKEDEASSRVGATISPRILFSRDSNCSIIGMPNAAVFPVPVWACPITSLPNKACGIVSF